jgi:glycosyltransferase involved in cell wall biosynthesis
MDRGSIVVVSPYALEYGPTKILTYVVAALAETGFRPVCIIPEGARRTTDLGAAAEVRTLPALETVPRTRRPVRLATFLARHVETARRIEAIAKEVEARSIYSISEAIFASGLAARRAAVPAIVQVIGMSIRSPRSVGSVYIRALDRLTDQFIACSSAVADMLADYGVFDEKISVVHNGVSASAILATEGARSPIDDRPGPRVGMVAAYDPRKCQDLFVRAASTIAAQHPTARFYLIGGVLADLPESIAFERRIVGMIESLGLGDRFERLGYVPPPEVYSWIRAMDVIVVPSKTEAFAHALLEAMLCGVPVVATGIEGNLDAFVHGHSGLFTPPSPDLIAEHVLALLYDPERRRQMGAAARERAQLFDLKGTLPALADVVVRAVDAGTGTR